MGTPRQPVEESRPAWDRWLDPGSRSGSWLPALGMLLIFFPPGWWRLTGFVIWFALDGRAVVLAHAWGTRREWIRAVALSTATVAFALQLVWSHRPHAISVAIWVVLGCCVAAWILVERTRG